MNGLNLGKINWPALLVIWSIHLLALLVFLPGMFSWWNVLAFFVLYIITGMGITFGYHRMLTHRSFKPSKIVYYFAIICGELAFQGGPIEWSSGHLTHHQFSDTEQDIHDSNKGFWWSHVLWIFYKEEKTQFEINARRSISENKLLVVLEWLHIPVQLLLGFFLWKIGGAGMVVWGIFFRLVFVYHTTWFVNSATHKWGYRLFETNDKSRNCWWVALLTFGEGWHNTHHAYQSSPRHGIKWWEIDLTYYLIWFLSKVKLVSNLKKIPSL